METVNQIEYNGALYNIQDAEAQKNLVYSQNEIDTGKIWIDGKKIYRKVINCGTLPNNTSKEVPINITNINEVVSVKGITFLSNEDAFLPLPYSLDKTGHIGLAATKTYIFIITYADRTNCINTYAILEYTKTTD